MTNETLQQFAAAIADLPDPATPRTGWADTHRATIYEFVDRFRHTDFVTQVLEAGHPDVPGNLRHKLAQIVVRISDAFSDDEQLHASQAEEASDNH